MLCNEFLTYFIVEENIVFKTGLTNVNWRLISRELSLLRAWCQPGLFSDNLGLLLPPRSDQQIEKHTESQLLSFDNFPHVFTPRAIFLQFFKFLESNKISLWKGKKIQNYQLSIFLQSIYLKNNFFLYIKNFIQVCEKQWKM